MVVWLMLCSAMSLAMMIIIWLRTDAFVEYISLLPTDLQKLVKVDEYNQYIKDTHETTSYPDFLIIRYNNFFTRLLSCPICISVWLGFPLSILFLSVKFSLAVSFMGLLFYYSLARLIKHE